MLIFIYNRLKSLNCTVYILKTISLGMKTRKGVRESISDLHNSCFENVSRWRSRDVHWTCLLPDSCEIVIDAE